MAGLVFKTSSDRLLRELSDLYHDPFSVDKINLKNETCLLKTRKSGLHLKKGEKMIRSLK